MSKISLIRAPKARGASKNIKNNDKKMSQFINKFIEKKIGAEGAEKFFLGIFLPQFLRAPVSKGAPPPLPPGSDFRYPIWEGDCGQWPGSEGVSEVSK